ncbi:MAG: hypothetical protein R6V20_07095 [Desulfobia sp.]
MLVIPSSAKPAGYVIFCVLMIGIGKYLLGLSNLYQITRVEITSTT